MFKRRIPRTFVSVFFSCKIDTIVVLYLKKFLFMKQLIPLSIALILMASGCATYDITVYGPDGAVHAEHTTDELYVGTDAFVLDAIIDPFVMVYSLFQPVPMLSSSMGIYGGMQLGSYISKMASLAPVSLIGGGSGSGITSFMLTDDSLSDVIRFASHVEYSAQELMTSLLLIQGFTRYWMCNR